MAMDEIDQSPPSVSGVDSGKTLVRLSENEREELKIETVLVESKMRPYVQLVSGVVFPALGHVSFIGTPIDGRISHIKVRDGQPVQKGQELFQLESLSFGNMVSDFLQATAEETFQATRLKRLEYLVEKTISSRAELERAQSDFQRASAVSLASVAKLKAIGVLDREIVDLKNGGVIAPALKIYSPINGVFDQRQVELGQSVNSLDMLGRVVNPSRVLVKGFLSPEDAQFISSGDSVRVTNRMDQKSAVPAIVNSVNPGLDEVNRSVVVNIEVKTKNNWPKIGENVRLKINTSTQAGIISIPVNALSYDGNIPIVYVKNDASSFEKRKLEIVEIKDQIAIVAKGLNDGEEIAITQIFSLKALSRYELIAEE